MSADKDKQKLSEENLNSRKPKNETEPESSSHDHEYHNDIGADSSGSYPGGLSLQSLSKYFKETLNVVSKDDSAASPRKKVIDDLTLNGLCNHWKENGFKNIITMVGAGISTSSGIPDFRSPGSGVYANLDKYDLPHPQAVFELAYFRRNPRPFFALAKELYPGSFKPTASHYFIRLLSRKGLLTRHYTQNIDTLERVAGIPGEKLVEAHGTFYTNHCVDCNKEYPMDWMKKEIFENKIPKCGICGGIVKPDIVFFGENLPDRFHDLPNQDFMDCDLLIIMGTSLEVHPFASLVNHAKPNCVRLLINLEKVGRKTKLDLFSMGPNLEYDTQDNVRDVAYIGNCDDGVRLIAKKMGWLEELDKLIETEHQKIDTMNDMVAQKMASKKSKA